MLPRSHPPSKLPTLCLAHHHHGQPPEPNPPVSQERATHEPEGRIAETVSEDLVTLDNLTGVTSLGDEYSFVQYRLTEKHKKAAGLKTEPVELINMFVRTLRETPVPIETCLRTDMPSGKRSFWIRVSLAGLSELSLEPLWKIRGTVMLCSKQRRLTITIDDRSLEHCVLHPESRLLLSQPEGDWTGEFLDLAKEGLCTDDRARASSMPNSNGDRVGIARGKHRDTATGARASRGPEPKRTRGERVEAHKIRNTQTVVSTNFIRGTQTRARARQGAHSKTGTNTVYRSNPTLISGDREERDISHLSPLPPPPRPPPLPDGSPNTHVPATEVPEQRLWNHESSCASLPPRLEIAPSLSLEESQRPQVSTRRCSLM